MVGGAMGGLRAATRISVDTDLMEHTELFGDKPAGTCAAIDCMAPSTHEQNVYGKHLRIAGVEAPKATVRFSAKLCDSHDIFDIGLIHRS